jgi:hypothetical protein
LALARAGKSSDAKMAMIAITTSNSISVKARFNFNDIKVVLGFVKNMAARLEYCQSSSRKKVREIIANSGIKKRHPQRVPPSAKI